MIELLRGENEVIVDYGHLPSAVPVSEMRYASTGPPTGVKDSEVYIRGTDK